VIESFQLPYLWQWKMGFGHHLRRPNRWMGIKTFFYYHNIGDQNILIASD
jgi:hypothetical protein